MPVQLPVKRQCLGHGGFINFVRLQTPAFDEFVQTQAGLWITCQRPGHAANAMLPGETGEVVFRLETIALVARMTEVGFEQSGFPGRTDQAIDTIVAAAGQWLHDEIAATKTALIEQPTNHLSVAGVEVLRNPGDPAG